MDKICIKCHRSFPIETFRHQGKYVHPYCKECTKIYKNENYKKNHIQVPASLLNEIWKDIPGYEGLYQASNLGRIKSFVINEKIMSAKPNEKGYLGLRLTDVNNNKKKKSWRVSRLIAITFHPNPNNLPEVNHIDGIKQNNRADNLEWATHSENVQHCYDTGLKAKKISLEVAAIIRNEYKLYKTPYSQLGKRYGVAISVISEIINNKVHVA